MKKINENEFKMQKNYQKSQKTIFSNYFCEIFTQFLTVFELFSHIIQNFPVVFDKNSSFLTHFPKFLRNFQ